jgi:hypothetical protein
MTSLLLILALYAPDIVEHVEHNRRLGCLWHTPSYERCPGDPR